MESEEEEEEEEEEPICSDIFYVYAREGVKCATKIDFRLFRQP